LFRGLPVLQPAAILKAIVAPIALAFGGGARGAALVHAASGAGAWSIDARCTA